MTGPAALRELAFIAFAAAIPAAAQETGDLDRLRQRALELVNDERGEAGLSPLSLGTVLNEAAQTHAADMAERAYYAHVTPDGVTPRDRFRAAGGSQWAPSGENIARCSGCAPPPDIARVEAFHEGWMQSPPHRENILAPEFDSLGFGIAGDEDEIYAVQSFAGPGKESDAPTLTTAEARAAALLKINARRQNRGLAALRQSDPLEAVAGAVLEARLSGEDLPQNIFDLLPEGAAGWTSVRARTASRGGSGVSLTDDEVTAFVESWVSAETDAPLGGPRAAYLGFAAAMRENGRATAVAVFGGRD